MLNLSHPLTLALLALSFTTPAHAGWPREVKPLPLQAGRTTLELSDLSRGKTVDLKFASDSGVACWPGTKREHFDGTHVFYSVKIPARSVLTVTAIPRDKKTDVSLYAFSQGTTNFATPPNVPSVVACEASYGTKDRAAPYNPGQAETLQLVATTHPYNALIAVAGAQGAKKGAFELKIDLRTKAAAPTGQIIRAAVIKAGVNVVTTVKGTLDGGPQIALDWAANSSVACFPATQNEHFTGAHKVFLTDLPPHSVMHVTLVPKDPKLDLSLYVYQVGINTKALPPNVTRVVTCEASYGTKSRAKPYNPGQPETVRLNALRNPYRVYIGVAGAQKAMKGAFELKVDLKTRGPAPSGKVTKVTRLTAVAGQTIKKTGRLDGGPKIALSWAAQSDVACFPSARKAHFTGAHVLYQVELPARSVMKVRLVPKDPTLDLSLYGYVTGTSTTSLPPNVPSVVSCEASYGTTSRSKPYNPGETEEIRLNATTHPYRVFIGVAGAQGVMKGAFTLEVELEK